MKKPLHYLPLNRRLLKMNLSTILLLGQPPPTRRIRKRRERMGSKKYFRFPPLKVNLSMIGNPGQPPRTGKIRSRERMRLKKNLLPLFPPLLGMLLNKGLLDVTPSMILNLGQPL